MWKSLQPFQQYQSLKRLILFLTLLVCWPGVSDAFLAVCGTPTEMDLHFWQFQVEATYVDTRPTCCLVSKAETPAQLTLVTTPGFDPRQYRVQTSPACLVVPKSPAALEALAAADAALAAEQATLTAELATNEACSVTSLAEAATRVQAHQAAIQTAIDGVTDVPTAQAALTTATQHSSALHTTVFKCLFVLLKRGGLR